MRKLAILGCVILLAVTGCETTSTNKNKTDTSSIALADAALKERNIPKAIELYQKALIKNPFDADIKNKLATCYLLQNNVPQAIKIYQSVLAQDAKNLTALRGISRAYLLNGDATAARPSLEQVVALSATSNNISALGTVYDMLGDHKAAQKQYDLALSKTPTDLAIINNKAFSLLMTGDTKNAIALLEKVINTEGITPQQRGNLALAYVLNNKTNKAQTFLSKFFPPEEVQRSLEDFTAIKERAAKGESLRVILFNKN
jgi:Flp pilus assembly protein TadD